MTSVKTRENTFKVDLSVFPKRPTFEEIHAFVHNIIGLRIDQVKRLQLNHVQNVAHVKCDSLKTAQDVVDLHNGRHEMEVNKVKYKVRLQMDDAGVEVKVHDLSENVRDEEIVAYMRQYGEVHCLKELLWGDSFAYKGVSSGIRVVRMTLKKHIKSFVTIQGEQTLITYRNQPQTCRHCSNQSHPGITCAENKKLLGQKTDLRDRLKSAQSNSNTPSYAGVVEKGTSAINSILPSFASTNLNKLVQNSTPPLPPPNPEVPEQQPSGSKTNGDTEGVEIISSPVIATPSTPHLEDDIAMDEEAIEAVNNLPTPMDQSTQQTPLDGGAAHNNDTTNESVSTFKVPMVLLPPKTVISENSESEESSYEGTGDDVGFKVVGNGKRGRGRPKKLKIDTGLLNNQ